MMQSATRSIAADHTMLLIRVYDDAGNVIETHEHTGDFKELWVDFNHVTATQRIKV